MSVSEERWMEYLDDELTSDVRAAVERRLAADEEAREELRQAWERRRLVRSVLARWPVDTPDADAFRTRVREEAGAEDGAPDPAVRGLPARRGLSALRGIGANSGFARAAAVVLLLVGAVGAAAAVPGSPVRAWLEGLRGGGGDAPAAETVTVSGPEEVGVRVRPAAGRLVVTLATTAPTAADPPEVRVRLVDGPQAAVYAAAGTRFRTGEGRVEAEVAAGPVRVEIPRGLTEASVRLDGRVVFEKRGADVEAVGAAQGSGADEYLFEAARP